MTKAHGSDRLRVGYESRNYGAARNTYAPLPGVEHVKLRRVPLELLARSRTPFGLHRVFVPGALSRDVDLAHLWNRVTIGRRPWGVSFEHLLPYLNLSRHTRMIRWQQKCLTSDSCRFIIGMSDYAVRELQQSTPPYLWPALRSKVHRIYPYHPYTPRQFLYQPPAGDAPLTLIFVGGDFFRKGGEAALRTIELIGDELNLQLTVVSRVGGGDYKGTPPDDVDLQSVRDRLRRNDRVTWFQELPHADVLKHIESHHVGLLPTLSDTFGYSVLECMGLGVPTIVTNIQALPEFTGQDTGWQVQLPIDERGSWLGRDPDLQVRRHRYHEAMEILTAQLSTILFAIRSKPEVLSQKSESTVGRCRAQFSPRVRAEQLADIYSLALRA